MTRTTHLFAAGAAAFALALAPVHAQPAHHKKPHSTGHHSIGTEKTGTINQAEARKHLDEAENVLLGLLGASSTSRMESSGARTGTAGTTGAELSADLRTKLTELNSHVEMIEELLGSKKMHGTAGASMGSTTTGASTGSNTSSASSTTGTTTMDYGRPTARRHAAIRTEDLRPHVEVVDRILAQLGLRATSGSVGGVASPNPTDPREVQAKPQVASPNPTDPRESPQVSGSKPQVASPNPTDPREALQMNASVRSKLAEFVMHWNAFKTAVGLSTPTPPSAQ